MMTMMPPMDDPDPTMHLKHRRRPCPNWHNLPPSLLLQISSYLPTISDCSSVNDVLRSLESGFPYYAFELDCFFPPQEWLELITTHQFNLVYKIAIQGVVFQEQILQLIEMIAKRRIQLGEFMERTLTIRISMRMPSGVDFQR